jgi:hypothetical protein
MSISGMTWIARHTWRKRSATDVKNFHQTNFLHVLQGALG